MIWSLIIFLAALLFFLLNSTLFSFHQLMELPMPPLLIMTTFLNYLYQSYNLQQYIPFLFFYLKIFKLIIIYVILNFKIH